MDTVKSVSLDFWPIFRQLPMQFDAGFGMICHDGCFLAINFRTLTIRSCYRSMASAATASSSMARTATSVVWVLLNHFWSAIVLTISVKRQEAIGTRMLILRNLLLRRVSVGSLRWRTYSRAYQSLLRTWSSGTDQEIPTQWNRFRKCRLHIEHRGLQLVNVVQQRLQRVLK